MGQREIMPYETTVKRKNSIQTAPMCRLDVEEQPGDVLHSPRYMVGRGVKRKLSDCEDPARGLPYPQQRQLVLDLCLDKLQSCQRRAEPSLHRSVLLANTLRQIQQEMSQEGSPQPPAAPPAPSLLHAATPYHSRQLLPMPPDGSPSLPREDDEGVRSARAERDAPSPPASSEAEGRSSDLLFGSFEISNSTSYLTDLQLDDIFEDIDTSMYDSTDFSVLACPASRGGGGGVAAYSGSDDNLKAFSSYTTSSTLQRRIMDLNDLDHIMEILVHS